MPPELLAQLRGTLTKNSAMNLKVERIIALDAAKRDHFQG